MRGLMQEKWVVLQFWSLEINTQKLDRAMLLGMVLERILPCLVKKKKKKKS